MMPLMKNLHDHNSPALFDPLGEPVSWKELYERLGDIAMRETELMLSSRSRSGLFGARSSFAEKLLTANNISFGSSALNISWLSPVCAITRSRGSMTRLGK